MFAYNKEIKSFMKRELLLGMGLLMGATAYADKVEFSTLPQAAQKTVNELRQGAVIEDIDKETKDGRTFYEVTFKRDGKNVDLKVNEDGSLIQDGKKGIVGDLKLPNLAGRKMQMNELPQAVQNTIRAHSNGAPIEDIDRETKDGRTVYDVAFKRDGKNTELKINEDGSIIQDNKKGILADAKLPNFGNRKMQLNELPAPVQKTIRAHANGAPIEDIDRETKDGRTVYDVAFKRDGKNTELKVAEDGTVIRDGNYRADNHRDNNNRLGNVFQGKDRNNPEVEFAQLPAAVQKSIRAQLGGATIADIDHKTRDGQSVYEVEYERKGRNTEFVVAEDGTILRQPNNRVGFVSRSRADVSRLPMAVQNSIREQSAGRPVADIDEETRDGRRVYEVEFKKDGKNTEVVIAEDGSVINESSGAAAKVNAVLGSGKVQMNELPAAVQRTIRAQSGGAVVEDIDREVKNGRTVYEVHFKRDGKNNEIKVGEDGTLIKD